MTKNIQGQNASKSQVEIYFITVWIEMRLMMKSMTMIMKLRHCSIIMIMMMLMMIMMRHCSIMMIMMTDDRDNNDDDDESETL